MKKKYKIIHSKPIMILFSIVVIILLSGIIVNSINLYNAIIDDYSIVIPAVWIASCIIELILVIILCFNRYIILTDKCCMCLQGLIFHRIPYDDMLLLREDAANSLLLLYYKVYKKNGEELVNYNAIPISTALFKEFIADIRRRNSNVNHENFDKNPTLVDAE